jgi:uncharacterized phage infection (PIP) family protein YhgE
VRVTSVLNQLLEQAVERSTELTGRAEAAESEVEELLKNANTLHELALNHTEALHKDFAEALEAVTSARAELDNEAGRADAALDGVPGRADTTEAKANELAEVRTRLATRVDESAQQVGAEFHDLELRVDEFVKAMDNRLAALDLEVQDMLEDVEKAQTQIADDEQHLRDAVHSLGVLATDKAREFVASLHAVMILLGRGVVDVSNDVLKGHNAALKAMRTGFTDEEPGGGGDDETWIHQALQPVRDAVAELALVPDPARQVLDQVAGILAKAGKAKADFSDIAGALQQAVPSVQSS